MSGADVYTETIKELSDRIVEAQRPIRVLSAINRDDRIKKDFFDSGFKQQPKVDDAFYEAKELKLNPEETRSELRSIEGDILGRLGPVAPAGVMMRFMCEQYRLVVDLLEARGTEQFSQISGLLYGTPFDVFHAGGPTITDLAKQERAAEGATFVEVFEAFRTDGLDEEEAWSAAHRIYRGSLPELGPFTKDLGYGKGLVSTLLYVRLAIQSGKAHRIPLLFCGKVDLLDMGVLRQLEEEGLVDQPSFVPPPFNDLPALAVALSLGGFTAKLDWTRLESDYSGLI